MELPVQIAFFRELELWQELKRQDRNFGNTNAAWRIEKDILSWSSTGHHHLGTPITRAFIRDPSNGILRPENRVDEASLPKAMENLVQRGFAQSVEDGSGEYSIRILKEGLLMGDVIADTQGLRWYRRRKYAFFYWVTWATIGMAVILLTHKFVDDVGPLVRKLFATVFRAIKALACY